MNQLLNVKRIANLTSLLFILLILAVTQNVSAISKNPVGITEIQRTETIFTIIVDHDLSSTEQLSETKIFVLILAMADPEGVELIATFHQTYDGETHYYWSSNARFWIEGNEYQVIGNTVVLVLNCIDTLNLLDEDFNTIGVAGIVEGVDMNWNIDTLLYEVSSVFASDIEQNLISKEDASTAPKSSDTTKKSSGFTLFVVGFSCICLLMRRKR